MEGTTGKYRLALPAGNPQNAAVECLWQLRTVPPLNPENDVTVHIVVEDFGDLGRAFLDERF